MSGDLPRGWDRVRVDSLASFVRGVSFKKDEATGEPQPDHAPVLRAGNLQDGQIVWEDLVFVPKRLVSEAQRLREGDIVVAMSSGSVSVVGKSAAVLGTDESRKAGFGAFCGVWRTSSPGRAHWLQHFFQTTEYRQHVSAAALGVNINNLRAEHIGALTVSLPPLPEQRRIVAKLEALQARSRRAKEALDTVPALLEQLRQSILAAAFRGDLTKDWRAANPNVEPASELLKRIRAERRAKWEEAELAKLTAKGKTPSDDKWKAKYKEPEPVDTTGLPELPEGWCWASGALMFSLRMGFAFKSEDFGDDGVPVVRQSDLTGSWVDLSRAKRVPHRFLSDASNFIVRRGDLLLAMSGSIGKLGRYTHDEPALLNQRVGLFEWLVPSAVPSEYLIEFASMYQSLLPGLGKGIAVQNVSATDVERVAIPIGPAEELVLIANRLASKRAALSAIRGFALGENDRLRHLESSLLATAFRGELVSQEPSESEGAAAPAPMVAERIEPPQRGRKAKG